MTAGSSFVFRHQFAALLATLLLMVVDRVSLREDAQRAFSRSRIPGSSLASLTFAKTLRCSKTDKIRRQDRRHRQAGSGRRRAFSRMTAPTPTTRPRIPRASSWGLKPYDERDATAEQIIQRLRKKVAGIEGAKFLYASAAEHHGRRPSQPQPNTNTP